MSQAGTTFAGEERVDENTLTNYIKPNICYLGKVNDRGKEKGFGILNEDRLRHVYIVGKTGMGKSTLLENMILQDIYNGEGVAFIDPLGESAKSIIDKIPVHRHKDVIYFNPSDTEYPIGFNMLETKNDEPRFLMVSGTMSIFKKVWKDAWSSRMEYILNNTLLALSESPGNTLLGALRMFTDHKFRARIVKRVQDPMISTFWTKEYTSWSEKYRTEAIAPIQNKIGQFFASEMIRNILGQAHSTISFLDIMDNRKIFIANLSKGKIGEDNSRLIGSMLVTKLQLSAMCRGEGKELESKPSFYLYVDEFQNFTTDSFATILSEARRYKIGLTMAHQYIDQLTETGSENIRNAVFGNVGTIICFKVGARDAEELEREFSPTYQVSDFLYLNQGQIIMKMIINNQNTTPFEARTFPHMFQDYGGNAASVINHSRKIYGRPSNLVKQAIQDWLDNKIPIPLVKLIDNPSTQVTASLDNQAPIPTPKKLQNQVYHQQPDTSSQQKLAFLRMQKRFDSNKY